MSKNAINYDSESYVEQFGQQFLETLNELLPQVRELEPAIWQREDKLRNSHQHLVKDQASALNIRFSTLMLASYQVLHNIVEPKSLIGAIRKTWLEPSREWILQGTRKMLDQSPDPFRTMVESSKERETTIYGESMAFERPKDDSNAYLLEVKSCIWNSFFRANGAAELMPLFCEFDTNWIDAIDPERDFFRFERPTTLGLGGDRCCFYFVRTTPKP